MSIMRLKMTRNYVRPVTATRTFHLVCPAFFSLRAAMLTHTYGVIIHNHPVLSDVTIRLPLPLPLPLPLQPLLETSRDVLCFDAHYCVRQPLKRSLALRPSSDVIISTDIYYLVIFLVRLIIHWVITVTLRHPADTAH